MNSLENLVITKRDLERTRDMLLEVSKVEDEIGWGTAFQAYGLVCGALTHVEASIAGRRAFRKPSETS